MWNINFSSDALTVFANVVPLSARCEQSLISTVSVRNCIKLYQTSEEHAAESLKTYCLQIISSHWVLSFSFPGDKALCIHNLNTRDTVRSEDVAQAATVSQYCVCVYVCM